MIAKGILDCAASKSRLAGLAAPAAMTGDEKTPHALYGAIESDYALPTTGL